MLYLKKRGVRKKSGGHSTMSWHIKYSCRQVEVGCIISAHWVDQKGQAMNLVGLAGVLWNLPWIDYSIAC